MAHITIGLESSLFLGYWTELSGSSVQERYVQNKTDDTFQPKASHDLQNARLPELAMAMAMMLKSMLLLCGRRWNGLDLRTSFHIIMNIGIYLCKNECQKRNQNT